MQKGWILSESKCHNVLFRPNLGQRTGHNVLFRPRLCWSSNVLARVVRSLLEQNCLRQVMPRKNLVHQMIRYRANIFNYLEKKIVFWRCFAFPILKYPAKTWFTKRQESCQYFKNGKISCQYFNGRTTGSKSKKAKNIWMLSAVLHCPMSILFQGKGSVWIGRCVWNLSRVGTA